MTCYGACIEFIYHSAMASIHYTSDRLPTESERTENKLVSASDATNSMQHSLLGDQEWVSAVLKEFFPAVITATNSEKTRTAVDSPQLLAHNTVA
jgi:hypothetical protein